MCVCVRVVGWNNRTTPSRSSFSDIVSIQDFEVEYNKKGLSNEVTVGISSRIDSVEYSCHRLFFETINFIMSINVNFWNE